MTCPRCGKRNAAISWYCQGCGASLGNAVNGAGWLRRRREWVALIALVAVVAGAAIAVRAGQLPRGSPASPSDAGGQVSAVSPVSNSEATAGAVDRSEGLTTPFPASPPSNAAIAPGLAALTATVVAAAMGAPAGGAAPVAPGVAASVDQPLVLVREGAPVWSAPLVKELPRLDGWLDDWPGPPLAVDAVVLGRAARVDELDLSGESYVVWTASDLGLGVHVIDDRFVAPPGGGDVGQGDSVELQLDTDLAEDWSAGAYDGDDWQIGLSPGDLAGRAPAAYVLRPGPARALPVARIAARRVADGYTIEAVIPWTALGLSPRGLSSFGLAVNLMDRDQERSALETVASSSPHRTASDPRTFGTLVLAGEGGAGMIEGGRPHGVAP